jgi:two-component system cell cycle sensor histidine kinase/response regulator CckA
VETSMSSGYERSYEVVALRKDGATFPAEVCGKPVPYQGRMVRVTSVRDLTDRKKMEGESLKAHKLESIVILSAGIAHDFNNILTTIMANLTLAKTYAKQGDELSKLLREAKRASLRARGLIEQLLAFSKGEAPVKKHASIKELLRGTVDVALSGSNVKVAFAIQEDLWEVEVDEVQIGQVIDNLVLNARQAMPDGGSMEVRAENRIVGKGEMPPLAEGRYVRVSIWDQGSGIPEENLDKVFDPYFTTKEKGNGLGLAIAYSIVKKHDGHIALESKVGVGTAFHVFLPSCN